MNLLILGAGGHGRAVREVAEAAEQYENIAFLDDASGQPDVLGTLSEYDRFIGQFDHAFVAIGNPEVRKKYQELVRQKYEIAVLIHPTACVSPSGTIGKGTVVMPKAVIQSKSNVGNGCIISAGAIVDHDATIGDYCHINAGAIVPSMTSVPGMTKVDYGTVYRKTTDDSQTQENKNQTETETKLV